MNDYGWLFRPRNKNIGVGWQTYYQAMSNVWVNACIQTYIDEIINLADEKMYNEKKIIKKDFKAIREKF